MLTHWSVCWASHWWFSNFQRFSPFWMYQFLFFSLWYTHRWSCQPFSVVWWVIPCFFLCILLVLHWACNSSFSFISIFFCNISVLHLRWWISEFSILISFCYLPFWMLTVLIFELIFSVYLMQWFGRQMDCKMNFFYFSNFSISWCNRN